MKNYVPTLEYIKNLANFIKFSDNPIPNSGEISTTFTTEIIESETNKIEQQYLYFGLELPTEENGLPYIPPKDLIAFRVIVKLINSFLGESEKLKIYREELWRNEKEFKDHCSYFTSTNSIGSITSGFVPMNRTNTIP